LPKDEFILVGESFSGPIAYQIALTKPEHLLSVIFVATFLRSPRPFLLNLSRLLPIRSMLSLPLPDFMIKSLLRGAETNKEAIDLLKQARKQVPPSVITFRLQEIASLKKPITACSIKSTYIQANNDKIVPASCLNDFKKLFSNLTVFQVKGSHMLLQSNPTSCADIVMNEIRLITNYPNLPT